VINKRICDMGQPPVVEGLHRRQGGNITCASATNLVLCTPTLICKGFMARGHVPDRSRRQTARGTRKRTSEAMTHLGIMRRQPAAKACVHAHPPHATAFAIANVDIPTA